MAILARNPTDCKRPERTFFKGAIRTDGQRSADLLGLESRLQASAGQTKLRVRI